MSLTGACRNLLVPAVSATFIHFVSRGEPLLDAQGSQRAECDILINVSLHIYLTVIPSRFLLSRLLWSSQWGPHDAARRSSDPLNPQTSSGRRCIAVLMRQAYTNHSPLHRSAVQCRTSFWTAVFILQLYTSAPFDRLHGGSSYESIHFPKKYCSISSFY